MKTLAASVALLGVWVTVGSHSADTGAVAAEARDAFRVAANAGAVVTSPAPATDAAPGVSSTLPDVSSEALTVVVRTYCQVCHNDRLMTGNVSLVWFDVDRADESVETAERMIRKLQVQMMQDCHAEHDVHRLIGKWNIVRRADNKFYIPLNVVYLESFTSHVD